MHQQAPLYWRASTACGLRKSGLPGPRGRRVVRILPSFSKGYVGRRLRGEPTAMDCGFVRGRRRE
eukprot:7755379-Pyramimonas_sp.AAC.1